MGLISKISRVWIISIFNTEKINNIEEIHRIFADCWYCSVTTLS